jgi:sensor histidine kinase regulating citrate/malate metabolism
MLFAALTLTKRIPALAVVEMVASDAPVGTAYAAADFLALALTREVGDLVTAAGLFAGDACNLMPSRPRMITIKVEFRKESDTYFLAVVDDGVGMSSRPAAEQTGSGLGQRLIRSMVGQLDGSLTAEPAEAGSIVSIRFPA